MKSNKFSDRIKTLRKEKAITQEKLAEIIQVSQKTIAHLENDYRKPSYELLIALADYFNVSLDYLTGRSDNLEINK